MSSGRQADPGAQGGKSHDDQRPLVAMLKVRLVSRHASARLLVLGLLQELAARWQIPRSSILITLFSVLLSSTDDPNRTAALRE